jgi:protein-tyrosine phosphatase
MDQIDRVDRILAIEVVRLPGNRYRFAWQPAFASGGVTVFAGVTPETIDLAAPLVRAARGGAEIEAKTSPCYFALVVDDREPLVVGARHLALDGSTNLRDVGGYAASDGRRVRWGRLFRSGHLSNLTDTSQRALAELDVHTVCDFRIAEERAAELMVLPHQPRLVTLDIPPGLNDRHYFHRLFARTEDPLDVAGAVETMLRGLIEVADRYQPMFDTLFDAADGAVLFNCSAGKERTGTGMVLLLMALGVPRSTIRHDFLLSKLYFPVEKEIPRVLRKYAVPNRTDAELLRLVEPMLDTRAGYVDALFAAVDERAGSDEQFLAERLAMSPERCARLRDKFLV